MKRVLDAWAILAWLQDEKPASKHVQDLLECADAGEVKLLLNLINAGEVYYRLIRTRGEEVAHAFWRDLRHIPLRLVGVTQTLMIRAARLKGIYPIAYADAFAVATAIAEDCPLVTGDPELRNIEGICKLEWLTRESGTR